MYRINHSEEIESFIILFLYIERANQPYATHKTLILQTH